MDGIKKHFVDPDVYESKGLLRQVAGCCKFEVDCVNAEK